MRIVAGSAKGRALKTPKSQDIRPTSDRVRESVFNILGQWLDQKVVLDLFAGTGALALEALSRNATSAVLVDRAKEAVHLCHENAEALGFSDRVDIMRAPASEAASELGKVGATFDVIFADPPYAERLTEQILEWVGVHGLLAPDGTLCIEHDRREEVPTARHGLAQYDQRRFGDTVVSFYRRSER